ncbi:MAG TPA: UDP-N-acetylmuramoyl-tripeptide--D-alanyl-D-alanine ligase [Blastocatellia bacterium]
MKLGEIIKIFGSSSSEDAELEPHGYSIDSRTIRAGDLFFAIRGEVHDGHRFVGDALAKGAIAAIVSREFFEAQSDRSRLIPVRDTLDALQCLASAVLKTWRGREIAITGSMGKTTTKEMTAAALSTFGRVMKTTGNFNNAFGLPLSILKMETDGAHASDFDFAVLEMGMNHRGELTELARIAPPDLAVVTNVAAVHLEFFSSLDEIAEAKSELVLGAKRGGAAALNGDDERVARMRNLRGDIEVRTFGIANDADVTARDIKADSLNDTRFTLQTPRGSCEVRLRLAGRHNIYNALAAATTADFYEAPLEDIAASLAESSSPRMRGEVIHFQESFTLVDDSYNSNPTALFEMASAIAAARGERKIIVAGEMLELGASAADLHRTSGRRLANLGIDMLIGVRGLASEIVRGAREAGMKEDATIFCETPDEAGRLLAREARSGDLILVKGSRGVKTEIAVERLKEMRR